MPKIAVIIPKYGLVGGAEKFAAELTEKLYNIPQYAFQVFANRWQSGSKIIRFHKIPIFPFPKFLTTISFAWFVQKRLRHGDFDLVHSHERIFAADLFTLHGVPHRYWVHSVRRKKMSLYDTATAWVEKRLVYDGHCHKFIAVSDLTKEIFLREYPINPDQVAVIHPGVNLTDYSQKNKGDVRHAVRDSHGISDTDLVILFASMNFEIKGLDDIIFSLAQLKKRNHQFKLIVAGKGNIRKYQKMAKEAQIAENVIFTGVVSKDRLIDLYLAGDLYMMLSKFDTFGMVVLDAMAAGLPVVVSSKVGAKDLVEEGKNGFVIDNPSDYGYIKSRLEILFNENTRKTLSAAALQTASQNTWGAVANQYQNIYSEILSKKEKRKR